MKSLDLILSVIFIATYMKVCFAQNIDKPMQKLDAVTMRRFKGYVTKQATMQLTTESTTTEEESTTTKEESTTTKEESTKTKGDSTKEESTTITTKEDSTTITTKEDSTPMKEELITTTKTITTTAMKEDSTPMKEELITTTTTTAMKEDSTPMKEELITTTKEAETSTATAATTIKSTTFSSVPLTCSHIWKTYDANIDKNAPLNDGVLAGSYYDKTIFFVGSGNAGIFSSPDVQFPARVSISQSGVYVTSHPSEALDSAGMYLMNHPAYNYEWVDFTTFNGTNDVNLKYTDNLNLSVCRVNLTENGVQFSVIAFGSLSISTAIFLNPVDSSLQAINNTGFEVLTCSVVNSNYVPTITTSKLCKLKWTRFDSKNPKNVENTGIIAGYYKDSTPVYVGRGDDNCIGVTPARVNTRKTSGKGSKNPGVYPNCKNKEYLDNSIFGTYLVNDTNSTFFWYPASASQFYINSVSWAFDGYTFAVARVKVYLNANTDEYFTTIGKVYQYQGTWYYNPLNSKTEMSLDDVDVLICTTDGSTVPILKSESRCINKWANYDATKDPDEPAKYGIYAGNYIDKSPFYVGSGIQTDYSMIVPARVSVNGSFSPGSYVTSYGSYEYFANKKVSYLVNNSSQTYEWKTIKFSESIPNAVGIVGQLGNHYMTRVQIVDTNNTDQEFQQMALNFNSQTTYYFNPIRNTTIITTKDIDILVCTINHPQN